MRLGDAKGGCRKLCPKTRMAAPSQEQVRPSASLLITTRGALPPASTCPLLLGCRRDCTDQLRAQQRFFWKAEREHVRSVTHAAVPRGFQSGFGELGRWAEPCRIHTHTHPRRQKLGPPPTSELSMLLISAKCPVCPQHLCQRTAAAPRSARSSGLCSPHALLSNSHLLIRWSSTKVYFCLFALWLKH